ncbi:MAG: histidine kinase [Bacteroidaceae bacterium]|nr:histidine kinase [Bacteroidaceae bacterium]
MKSPFRYIKRSLSLKLCLGILGFVLIVFILCTGFLVVRSRQMVRQEATERATLSLNNTAQRVSKYIKEVETATRNIHGLVLMNLRPDSLLNYTHRVVELNPNINGCSITMEPDFFPQHPHGFSAYTLRVGDSIETVIEGEYNYYEKVWYKTPRERDEACWVDPFNDYQEGTLSSPVMIASYCQPLHSPQGNFIGVISTDLSTAWLSSTISAQKPSPHSYCLMLGSDGRYFVHPNHVKILNQSIFEAFDAEHDPDIITLGHEMTEGKTGQMRVSIDGHPCLAFYQPLEHTSWSIALVCPEADIFAPYTKLAYLLVPLIIVGLLFIIFICWKTIQHFITPLNQLAKQSRHITDNNFDHLIERSQREDVVGNLQNSFVSMQQTINEHITSIQRVNEETEKRNAELIRANQLAQEADERKNTFVNETSHQIRTPLNIIAGFTQVLRDFGDTLSAEEIASTTDDIAQNAATIRRMASMLFDASWVGEHQTLDLSQEIDLNVVIEDAIKDFKEKSPHDMPAHYTTNMDPADRIHTNQLYLHRTLRELLINAKKFASEGAVNLIVDATDAVVRIIIEDHGPGIPLAEQEHIFHPFVKLDNYSEGLGLGLGLCLRHAQALNGTLTLDPTYTNGARFILEIPK